MKPKLRPEASLEFHNALVAASHRTIETAANYPFQTCLFCVSFNEERKLCARYNEYPPAKIIVFGCDKFDDVADIPF